MASTTTDKIWTTLLTNRGYLAGLLVLDQSIKKHGSAYPLVVMISGPVTADQPFLDTLEAAGIPVKVVDKITPKPRPGVEVPKGTWEKLAPWSFTEYEVSLVLLLLFAGERAELAMLLALLVASRHHRRMGSERILASRKFRR